MLYHPLTL